MSTKSFMVRQGDVLVVSASKIPDDLEPVAKDAGRVVLAYGELTGHAHAIIDDNAALFRDPKLGALFLRVSGGPVALVHEEHTRIDIPPGDYKITHQVEYRPTEIVRVSD